MDLCKDIARSTFIPGQLRRLYKIPKLSPEFELAFAEFYDNFKREKIIDNLHGARLQEFVDFLDEVLQLNGLGQDLFRRVLHTLWRICSKRRILPGPHLLSEGLLRVDGTEIASGGFASIWRGVLVESSSSPDPRNVCIKMMKFTVKDGTEGRCDIEKMFYEEISIWMRLKHPNVVRCLGAITSPNRIVLDWMQDGEVMHYLQRNPGVSRIDLVLGVTKGLDYLHSRGVVHGDVKPNNILVNHNGDACLADFGLAIVTCDKRPTGHEDPTARGHSSLWAAPETLTDARISKETDVFSYGLVAIGIFKGEPPWGKVTAVEIMTKIMLEKRPDRPEGTEALGLTTELWNCLTNCLHQKAEDRITISEVLVFLNSTARSEGVTVGASGSELSISEATPSVTVGTMKSTSTRQQPSSTHHHQHSDSRSPPQTGMTSRRPSHHHTSTTEVKLSEVTAASHLNPVIAQGERNARPFKTSLKRLLCVPSCISDKDMVG